MKYQLKNQFSRATTALAVSGLVVASSFSAMGPAMLTHAADPTPASSSAEATISVTIDRIELTILEVNGTKFGDNEEANNTAIRTLNSENTVKFKADRDAHVKLVADGKVLWEGDVKAGEVKEVKFTLANTNVGVHAIEIQGSIPGINGYSQSRFSVDYRPVIPSIIPSGGVNAPNTGLYFNLGGQMYSATTIAIVLLLATVIVYLLVRHNSHKAEATAEAASTKKVKAARKKMDIV